MPETGQVLLQSIRDLRNRSASLSDLLPPDASLSQDQQAELDSLSDLTQEVQLRMQIYMEARNKAAEILSNLLKKFSETAQAIIANSK